MGAGRPEKYTKEELLKIRDDLLSYIEENDVPILAEFAYKNNIRRQRLYEYSELSDAIEKCVTKKEAQLEILGLSKQVDISMAIFSLKQLGWRDRFESVNENKDTISADKSLLEALIKNPEVTK